MLTCFGVGKSSLTVQFVENHFVESYYPTIENTFSKTIKYKGQEFATEIIDTAGQVFLPSHSFLLQRYLLPEEDAGSVTTILIVVFRMNTVS